MLTINVIIYFLWVEGIYNIEYKCWDLFEGLNRINLVEMV